MKRNFYLFSILLQHGFQFFKASAFLVLLFIASAATAQVNNWEGDVSSDYFNKHNWSDTSLNYTSLNAWTLRIVSGSPNNCVLTGGNSSNVNYRPGRINTIAGAVFTVNGAVYPNNNDSLNGTIIVNAPADFNIRNIVNIGNRQSATITINGGSLSSRNGMNIATGTGGSALVTVAGGSLNAGAGGSNMDLNVANAAGLTATINISGGSVKVGRNLNIGAGGKIHISGIGLLQILGNKTAQLNSLVADGRLTCTAGKTLSIEYDGVNTTAFIPQDPNSMLREYGDSVVLNNGVIRARIAKASGNILSLKYNGVEQLNQLGSTRTGAYHDFQTTNYGFETMNNCVFTIKKDDPNIVDISLKRSYNPATGQVTPADADIHYVLNKGDTGLYSYSILTHKPEYPAFGLGSWRLVEWIAQDGTNYLCENIYVDSLRRWQMPSVADFNNASPTPIAEIVKLNTGVRAGKYDGKYEYTAAFWQTPVWGHASTVNKIGTWVVLSSPEYFNGGPTHQDLNAAAGINHVLLNGLHYGDQEFVIPQGEQWSKIYGPYLLYTSAKPTADENWADAKKRGEVEKAKWPYSWLTNTPEYPLANERGSVSGRFTINDPAKPGLKVSNAWVGVTKISNPQNEWQHEGKNYHYWVQPDADGNFTIPNVRPGTYTFFAYSEGVVQEYRQENVTVTAGETNSLGTVTLNVPRDNGNLLWEIGVANRKADEFKLGKFDYCEGFVEQKFRDTFPALIEYNVVDKNWADKLPFAHTKYPTESFAPGDIWKWRINFTLPAGMPATGNARLTIAYASNDNAQQWIYVNNESSTFTTYFPENSAGNAFIRQANYAKYTYKHVLIPMSRLRAGNNTITLVMPSNSGFVSHLMYDYISLEAVAGILPVTLVSFTAQAVEGNKAELKWSTETEINNSHFVVERSKDGIAFQPAGIVSAAVGSGTKNYTFTDANTTSGINYYRLKQVDKDGGYSYSETRQVRFENAQLAVYPNPVSNLLTVQSGSNKELHFVKIVNAEGKVVLIKDRISTNRISVDVSGYPAGLYFVQVSDGTNFSTEKIRKQ